ncbi:hypothetical protein A1359_20235 [Methylomonas lenta]|uniref:Uncharacterized protein n=1 Tax=Methylomonas lenta TaxID=980561 RepID=A0A177NSM6_9GAMM|nr:hypothetical protein [Methylomonas lenta]OAI20872.1 hypothetical protein A1359_20235 [Methylomonas lenta]
MTIVLLQSKDTKNLKLELATDGAGRATAIDLSYGAPVNAKATFKLAAPLDVPAELLLDEGGVQRLKNLPKIREELASGTQQLEDRWHDLVTRVSTAALVLEADGKFAGALALPSGSTVTGLASFNLGASLSNTGGYAEFRGFVAFTARCKADVNGAQLEIVMVWRIDVAAATEIPTLSLHIPSLGVALPSVEFPRFDWTGWNPGSITPDIRLPALPGLPIKGTSGVAKLEVSFDRTTSSVKARLEVSKVEVSAFGSDAIDLGNLEFKLENGKVTVAPFQALLPKLQGKRDFTFLPLGNLTVFLHKDSWLELALDVDNGRAEWVGCVEAVVSIFPALQPTKQIKACLRLPFRNGQFEQKVEAGAKGWERKIDLLEPTLNDVAGVLIEHLPSLNGIAFSFRMPGATLPSTDGLVEVLAAILGAIGRGATGLARIVQSVLEKLFKLLRSAAQSLGHLEVLFVLDATNGRLLQLVVQLRHAGSTGKFEEEVGGFELKAPKDADLALLIDLRDGAQGAYAVVTPQSAKANDNLLYFGTDLWFATDQLERPTGDATVDGKSPAKLISVNFNANNTDRLSLVPFGVRNGQATFLQALTKPLPILDRPDLAFDGYELVQLEEQVKVTAKFPSTADLKKRLLPFLAAPSESSSGGAGDWLKQYIEINNEVAGGRELRLDKGTFNTPLDVFLHVMGAKIESTLQLSLDARKMTASLKGGLIYIDAKSEFELFGMKVTFTKNGASVDKKQFVLDLGSSDPRLYLAEKVTASLQFTALDNEDKDTQGRYLRFEISHFVVHGGGLDLDAKLAERFTLKLPGLETDFTFDEAAIKVSNGRAESFRLKANGKLPPQLLGNVDVKLELDFGDTGGGNIDLLDGRLDLVSKGNAIRSDQTHFEFRLESLGLRVFKAEGKLHFCAFLTGSALFKPTVSELAEGMLKKLANVELRFTDCPICGPSDIIKRELEKLNLSFVVALDEPVRAALFEMFLFEVRSIGFEPRSNLFDDRPFALVIGGQVRFAERGDVVRAECDFHKLYIAPGKDSIIPRIRCEGLGLALRLGSALEIEGKVVAVDGRMPPNVLLSRKSDLSLEANGFMGQGRVAIQGLPPFAASFGFVEIRKPGWPSPRLAWFVYLEAQRISYYFQLGPVPFYLREAGLGLGYYFTYVGIKKIDEADNLIDVIKELDKIALTALEPSKLDTWDISDQGDLTLVARAMFSMSSASTPAETLTWHKDEEEPLPNLLLLNAVLAMRKSTFMMTANGWLGYSYYDWDKGRLIGANDLTGKQALTGYIVLAGARSEFLARLVSNPGVEIGRRLALPQQFKDGIRDFQYDATLYMRPGLLHFELGWPNRIRWSKNIAGVNVTVAGGAIFRVHDGAVLAGLNLEGQLSFDMSGSLDAGVVGISISASVYATLIARIIGYLDSRNASNSLYYSLFSLQVSVEFRVSAWLEIDAWLCKITIRASFSFSLQIDVVAELALQGDGQGDGQVGARIRATIAVSVFGRSLGLSVGLAMSPGLVDNAAARVGRFMNLGLIQDTPSSVAPISKQDQENMNAATVGAQRREARVQAAAANLPESKLAPVPHEEKVPSGFERALKNSDGQLIGATDFHAVLSTPKAKPKDVPIQNFDPRNWVYMTFLPQESFDEGHSSFYACPPNAHPGKEDHKIEFSDIPQKLQGKQCFYFKHGSWESVTLDKENLISTFVQWDASLGYTQSNKDSSDHTPREQQGLASLTQLFFAAFRTKADNPDLVSTDKPYQEPWPKPKAFPKEVPTTQQEQFNRQEGGYLGAITQDPADRRCHEARDFLLHKFASDLFDLAQDGVVPEKEAHVAHLGLTMLVPKEVADALDDAGMKVRVLKRIDHPGNEAEYAPSNLCQVFNPPKLRYEYKHPGFEDTGISVEGKTVKLHWKLRWPGEDAADGLPKAETYLKHYSIVRSVMVGITEYASAPVTVTCAVQEEYSWDDDRKTFVRFHHVSNTRFTDNFENVAPTLMDEMFSPGSGAVVRYAVTPVCVSDTFPPSCSDFVATVGGDYQFPRLSETIATLKVDPHESGNGTGKAKEFDLDIHLEADAATAAKEQVPSGMSLWWRVVARGESILPAGQYGSDAESRRSLATTIGSGLDARPGDHYFDVELSAGPLPGPVWKFHRSAASPGAGDLAGLQSLIQGLDDPQSWTLLAQVVLKKQKDGKYSDVSSSRLVAMKHVVKVKGRVKVKEEDGTESPDKWEDRYVVTQVPALEFVRLPFDSDVNAGVMAPVASEDVMVLPGRAALPEPSLPADAPLGATLNLHPEFGAVSRLFWNLRPFGAKPQEARRFRLRSGFDVYSLSLDTGLDPDDSRSWAAAKRLSEVRLLGDERVRLVPGEIGEPSNWKMRYPSHALRREPRGAWWPSAADASIDWPKFPIRMHPLPEPSSELIKALLVHGTPDLIALEMVHPKFKGEDSKWEYKVDESTGWTLDIITPKGTEGSKEFVRLRCEARDPANLRTALRSLTVVPNTEAEYADSSDWDRDRRAGWTLELQPLWEKPDPKGGATPLEAANQDPERVAMDFERDLHPAIECMLTHMRRRQKGDTDPDVLFDVDRRPAPIVKATQLDEFMGVTGDAADPYGWAALDRLGLGVTVRLYDSFNNCFLEPRKLLAQVKEALIQTKAALIQGQKSYPSNLKEDYGKYLFVECLLQPGAMTQRIAFERLPEDNGAFEKTELDTQQMLAMIRISMRPRIKAADRPFKDEPDAFPGWRAFWIALRRAMTLPLTEPIDDTPHHKDATTLARADFDERKGQWRQWNRRYFEFAGDPDNVESRFAFGAVEQTQPVFAAANAIGQISVTLPEADGWAHRRAFALVPQWRYADLLRDCGVEMDKKLFANQDTQEPPGLSSRALEAIAPARLPAPAPAPHSSRVISSIERTAPVLPQVAYSLGRIGDTQWWVEDGQLVTVKPAADCVRLGIIPGKDIVFALPLHPEQVLDEDNAPLARSLSRAGLAWQLGLHSADAAWSGEYQGGHHLVEPPATDTFDEKALVELLVAHERQGQSVAQAKVRVVRNLPHWYRHTVHASASAGIAVSPATAAYLPQAYASLVMITDGKLGVKPGHPWENLLAAMAPARLQEGPAKSVRYRVDLPVLRNRDTTDEATATLWSDAISFLPDPQVIYDLEFCSKATPLRPQRSVRPLARIFRSSAATLGHPTLQVMPIAKDWEVTCDLGDDIGGTRQLAIQVSPFSAPVMLNAALKAALGATEDAFRVPGGWSFDWLDALVLRFAEPSTRLSLAASLWSALAQAEVGLPEAAELGYFPTYEMRQLKLKRPENDADREQLKQVIGDWLAALASAEGNLDDSLAAALRLELAPILKQQWPFGDEYSLTVPWISAFAVPAAPAGFDLAPGSSPRHLVPELMSETQYAEAKRAAGAGGAGAARIDALWAAQKERAWDAGELVIRATRGDAIPLELAPVALV